MSPHAKKNIMRHHYRTLPKENKNLIVSAIMADTAMKSNNTEDLSKDIFDRIKAKLIFKWPKTLID